MYNRREIVFIDTSLSDWETLLASFSSDVEVALLDPDQNGVEQIAAHLSNQTAQSSATRNGTRLYGAQTDSLPVSDTNNLYDVIHILSHGSAGHLYLGSTDLSADNLIGYQSQLQQIGAALTDTGDLLLYGCNVAQGEVGNQFISALAEVTGMDVAASSDATGNASLGGNWVLESKTGNLEATPMRLPYLDLLGLNVIDNTVLYPSHTLGELSNYWAFAAIKADGSVVTWGNYYYGGDSSAVAAALDGSLDVVQIFSTGGCLCRLARRWLGGDVGA